VLASLRGPDTASILAALSLAGCCLSVLDGTDTRSTSSGGPTCLQHVPSPRDAGPMLTFKGNPFAFSSPNTNGFRLVSASGVTPPDPILAEFVPSSDSVKCPSVVSQGELTVTCTSGAGVLSISSNEAGTEVVVESILSDGGKPTCTWLGEPCGTHGECCLGLSCQTTDGGCWCAYEWPACYPWEIACLCPHICGDAGTCSRDDAGNMFCIP
jgi:hypothetical protein